MTRPMVRIHNVQTNEIVDREMTDDEFAQYEIDQADRDLKAAQQAAKDEAKAAVLQRLGITAEEATLLLS